MSEEKDCPTCLLIRKVFGDKFGNCSDFSNQLAIEAVDTMIAKVQNLQAKVLEKSKNGELTDVECDTLLRHFKVSLGFATASIAALMVVEGPQLPPGEMVRLVQEQIRLVITSKFADDGVKKLMDIFGIQRKTETDPKLN
jgi:hypothetical protein